MLGKPSFMEEEKFEVGIIWKVSKRPRDHDPPGMGRACSEAGNCGINHDQFREL